MQLLDKIIDEVNALREIAPVLMGFKRGRRTFTRTPVVVHRPT